MKSLIQGLVLLRKVEICLENTKYGQDEPRKYVDGGLAMWSLTQYNTSVFWDSETWNLYLFVDLKCWGKVIHEFGLNSINLTQIQTQGAECRVCSYVVCTLIKHSACSEGIKRKLKQNFELTLVKPRFSRGHSSLVLLSLHSQAPTCREYWLVPQDIKMLMEGKLT